MDRRPFLVSFRRYPETGQSSCIHTTTWRKRSQWFSASCSYLASLSIQIFNCRLLWTYVAPACTPRCFCNAPAPHPAIHHFIHAAHRAIGKRRTPMHDDTVRMAIHFSFFENWVDSGRDYAEGGPREEVASNGAWRTGSKSGAGASQATRNTGVTVAITVVCRKGSGPTWHSRQQWSVAWCDSSWEASARDCPQRVRHTSRSAAMRMLYLRVLMHLG